MSGFSVEAGGFLVHAVSDGRLAAAHDNVLDVDQDTVARLTGVPVGQPIMLPVWSFVFEAAGKRVLVDAGTGTTLGPALGHLPENLGRLGLTPGDIDAILLTHCHTDHSNGLVDEAGQPWFPNATVYLHEREAAFWLDRDLLSSDSPRVTRNSLKTRAVMAPYRDRLVRVDEDEIWPGVRPILRGGHTPGHTTWLLGREDDGVLIWGDTVHIAAVQVALPQTGLVFDVDARAGAQSREAVLAWAAQRHIVVAGAHLGGAFARVALGPDGYGLQRAAGSGGP